MTRQKTNNLFVSDTNEMSISMTCAAHVQTMNQHFPAYRPFTHSSREMLVVYSL